MKNQNLLQLNFGLKIFGFNIALPKFITPSVVGVSTETDKGWLFNITIKPNKFLEKLIGDIVVYKGEINSFSTRN